MQSRVWATLLVATFLMPLVSADGAHSIEGSHLFELKQANTPLIGYMSGTNCVALRQPAEGVTGEATATWTAQSPLAERLEVVLAVFTEAGREETRVTGTSPLTLHLDDVDIPPAGEGWPITAMIVVQLTETGAALQQEVLFEYALTYDGAETLEPAEGGCFIG